MGEKRKLLAALDAYKGRDVKAERQKKLRKQAEKKKKAKSEGEIAAKESRSDGGDEKKEINVAGDDGVVDGDEWETDESGRGPAAVRVDRAMHEP